MHVKQLHALSISCTDDLNEPAPCHQFVQESLTLSHLHSQGMQNPSAPRSKSAAIMVSELEKALRCAKDLKRACMQSIRQDCLRDELLRLHSQGCSTCIDVTIPLSLCDLYTQRGTEIQWYTYEQ